MFAFAHLKCKLAVTKYSNVIFCAQKWAKKSGEMDEKKKETKKRNLTVIVSLTFSPENIYRRLGRETTKKSQSKSWDQPG